MTAPSHSLRFVFALSMFICSIILVLFLRGSAALTTEFWVQLFAAALALCTAICFIAFRKGNMRLVDVPLGRLVRVFLWQLVFVYIASATAFSAIAMAVVYAAMRFGAQFVRLGSHGRAVALALACAWHCGIHQLAQAARRAREWRLTLRWSRPQATTCFSASARSFSSRVPIDRVWLFQRRWHWRPGSLIGT